MKRNFPSVGVFYTILIFLTVLLSASGYARTKRDDTDTKDFYENWYAIPLLRYQKINAIIAEEGPGGQILIKSSGINQYNALSVLNWNRMLGDKAAIRMQITSVRQEFLTTQSTGTQLAAQRPVERQTASQVGVGILLSEDMTPALKPARSGRFVIFAWDVRRNQLIAKLETATGTT